MVWKLLHLRVEYFVKLQIWAFKKRKPASWGGPDETNGQENYGGEKSIWRKRLFEIQVIWQETQVVNQ
jgi:hypothetical protein